VRIPNLLLCLSVVVAGCSSQRPQEVTSSQKQEVYVDGDFHHPGVYAWTNGMTLQDAITAAGGFNAFAQRRLRLRHANGTTERYRVTVGYELTNNPTLTPGDAILNPRE
jgi:protein involved in polysaccharide export with SLBB domain